MFWLSCFLPVLVILTTTTGQYTYTWSDCLAAVSNSTDGIEVKISCERDLCVHEQNFPGSYLSPLNSNEIWVENLTISDSNSTGVRYALLLPLQSNVGVLEVQYNSETEQWASSFSPLGGIDEPCQTLFIQKVLDTLLCVCIYPFNGTPRSIKVYKIVLNTIALQESTVRFQNFASQFSGSYFTNMVYANLDERMRPSEQKLFVVWDGHILGITPLEHGSRNSPTHLEFEECVNLTCASVNYIRDYTLLVHCQCCAIGQNCTPYGIYYDIEHEKISETISGALPYECPDVDTTVVVNVTSHRFKFKGVEHSLEGDGFREGLCSGNSSSIWFAYQDNAGHIFSTGISSSSTPTLYTLSESGCLDPNCSPITNVSDILVIQETGDQVIARGLNPNSNYTVLYEVHSPHPNFFALISYPSRMQLQLPSLAPSPMATPTSKLSPAAMPTSKLSPTVTPTSKERSSNLTRVTIVILSVIAGITGILTLVIFVKCHNNQVHRARSREMLGLEMPDISNGFFRKDSLQEIGLELLEEATPGVVGSAEIGSPLYSSLREDSITTTVETALNNGDSEKHPQPVTDNSKQDTSGLHVNNPPRKNNMPICSSCSSPIGDSTTQTSTTPTSTTGDSHPEVPPTSSTELHRNDELVIGLGNPGEQATVSSNPYPINTEPLNESRVPSVHRPDPDGSAGYRPPTQ